MPIRSRLVIGGTGELVLDELWDPATGTYANAATVTGSLFDPDGTPNVQFQNVAMPYVAASNGRYRAVVPVDATEMLARGDVITAEVTAVLAGGVEMPFRQRIRMIDSGVPRT